MLTVYLVLMVAMVPMVSMVLRERLVIPDLRENRAEMGRQGSSVLRVNKDHLDLLMMEQRENQGSLVLMGYLDPWEQRASKETVELMVRMDLPVCREPPDLRVLLASLVPRDHKEIRESPVQMVSQVYLE